MHVAPEGLCLKLQCIQRSVTLLDTRCNRNQIFRINNTSTDCLPVLPACHLHAPVVRGDRRLGRWWCAEVDQQHRLIARHILQQDVHQRSVSPAALQKAYEKYLEERRAKRKRDMWGDGKEA